MVWNSLRLVIPIIQILLVLFAYGATQIFPHNMWLNLNGSFVRQVAEAMNFPILGSWSVLFAPLGRFPLTPPTSRLLFLLGNIFVDLLVASSLFWFWHIVVKEVEARTKGGSVIRLSTFLRQMTLSGVFLAFSFAALFQIYYGNLFSLYNSSIYAIARPLLLIGWSIVLGGTAIYDLIVVQLKSGGTAHRNRAD